MLANAMREISMRVFARVKVPIIIKVGLYILGIGRMMRKMAKESYTIQYKVYRISAVLHITYITDMDV